MSQWFTLIRYLLSLTAVVGVLYVAEFQVAILIIFGLLWINNTLDDVVFYYGSKHLNPHYYNKVNGVMCPVDGVVTAFDQFVPLYHHLEKVDPLTKQEIIQRLDIGLCREASLYSHITVFLNKFNKHVVANIGSKVVAVRQVDLQGNRYPMVENGQLIADNHGLYLTNPLVVIEYANGVVMVLTMDKYISKAVPFIDPDSGLELFICRGSQCDLYIPSTRYVRSYKVGQRVHIFDNMLAFDGGDWQRNPHEAKYLAKKIGALIVKHCDARIDRLLAANFKKALHTFTLINPLAIVCLIAISFLPLTILLGAFLYIIAYCFAVERFVKNALYATMNIFGYKEWMTTLYRPINKIFRYHGK